MPDGPDGGDGQMAVMVRWIWNGITPEQYEAVWSSAVDQVQPLVHLAAFDGSTLHVTQAWPSEADARAFLRESVLPAAAGAGVESRPEVTVLPAATVVVNHPTDDLDAPPAIRRILVVANRTLGAPQLDLAIRARLTEGACHVHVLVPVAPPRTLPPQEAQEFSDPVLATDGRVPTSEERARTRLYAELDRLHGKGAEATGELGGSDPLESVRAVLAQQRFDEIILSTMAPGMSRWLRMDLPSRLQRVVPMPVSVVIAPELDN